MRILITGDMGKLGRKPVRLQAKGSEADILAQIEEWRPGAGAALERVKERVPFSKRQVNAYQGAVLYALARAYNQVECRILEIGTAWGFSAACLAEGAPKARIVTLNPKEAEVAVARKHLAGYRNVEVVRATSQAYRQVCVDSFDLIFVDGDHTPEGLAIDLDWWQYLKPGGLMLFHDYSPSGSGRPCPSVYHGVNKFAGKIGQQPENEVLIMDDQGIGMAGFVKKYGG